MSDILVIDRQNNLHGVDYCGSSGNKYTLCGVTYTRKDIINTLALDNTVSDICSKCHDLFTQMYESDLNDEPQTARGRLQDRLKESYDQIQDRISSPDIKYGEMLASKIWYKMNVY